MFLEAFETLFNTFDDSLKDTPAHQIVLAAATLLFLYQQYQDPSLMRAYRSRNNTTWKQRALDFAYDKVQYLPVVRKSVEQELDKNLRSTREKLIQTRSAMTLQSIMPEHGLIAGDILLQFGISEEVTEDEHLDVNAEDGKDSGALYAVYSKTLKTLLQKVYVETALSNPMHDKWPRINAMQAEIIQWCQSLFHGTPGGYGLITHGGTTSIIEAMSSYVRYAREKQGILIPEIVVPATAHAAFKKAAALTGAHLIVVPVNPVTGAVDPQIFKNYLSSATAVMVCSAPSFMNGIHDPVSELGALAQKHKIPLHVDACLGGFLTAFLDTQSEPLDFRVPGVTSISADLHKYGYCPKGTSVLVYREGCKSLCIYPALNWSGGLYATPGILDGSTSGARIAEIYTVLSYLGKNQYQKIAQSIVSLRKQLQELVMASEFYPQQISIFGDPQWSVLGFKSHTLDAHHIAQEMDQRGWKLNCLQNPKGFHMCLTYVHVLKENFVNDFIKDLDDSIKAVLNYPPDKKPVGNVKVYGAVGTMPTQLQKDVCEQYQMARLQCGLFSQKSTIDDSEKHLRDGVANNIQ